MTRFFRLLLALTLAGTGLVVQAQNRGVHAQNNDLLATAWQLETSADYAGAVATYRQYLASKPPKSAERRHIRIKLPVLQEAITHGAGPALDLFLSALNARAVNDISGATALLERIVTEYPSSRQYDDALYLKSYIAMMDNFDFQLAHDTLQSLRYSFPQSRYFDTALYSEAIAQEQLGNKQQAIDKLYELRARHTGVSLATMAWPRDEYLSRLWFDRSQRRLEYLLNHQQNASTLVSMDPYGRNGYAWRATVSVESHDISLVLNRSQLTTSTRITNADGTVISSIDSIAFAGQVEGEPASWARVTLSENTLRGVVSVDGRKIHITPSKTGGTLSDFHPLLLGDLDGNESMQQDRVLHPPAEQNPLDQFTRRIRQSNKPSLPAGTVGHVAPIGVVIDSKYNDYHGGRGVQEALAILNTTDGIFREQLGLAISIDTIVLFDDQNNDPMNLGSVTMETMMRNFRDYRRSSKELGSDIGLATLFSGNKNLDSALGLAWIGAACRTDGYDVSVVTPYKLANLLSTHEIGHTLGAPHDSDTACSSQTTNLMWPYLSDRTKTQFTSCSTDKISELLSNSTCLVEAIDLEAMLQVNEDSVLVTVNNLDSVRYTSGASLTVKSNKLDVATIPANCRLGVNELTCDLPSLRPASSSQIQLQMSAPLTDDDIITATVKPIGFMDVVIGNNSLSSDINGNTTYFSDAGINNYNGAAYSGSGQGSTTSGSASGGGRLGVVDIGMLVTLLLISVFISTQRRSNYPRQVQEILSMEIIVRDR